jgi:RNA polymerase sigma factor (sigma-70 family)
LRALSVGIGGSMSKRPPKRLSDLIRQCQEGDERAWHRLIDLIAPVIFSICKKSKLSRDESFDIYGQVCLQLVNNIGSLRSPEKILSFVATITRRQIFTFYNKMQVFACLDDETVRSLPDDTKKDPEKIYESIRKREILMEAMLSLPERDYKLIKALFFEQSEPTYEEIARRLNMPVSSVGPIRAKALTKLYKILSRKRYEF